MECYFARIHLHGHSQSEVDFARLGDRTNPVPGENVGCKDLNLHLREQSAYAVSPAARERHELSLVGFVYAVQIERLTALEYLFVPHQRSEHDVDSIALCKFELS